MKKVGFVIALTVGMILVYLLLFAIHPAISDIVDTANTSANWTGFEETQNAVNAFPLYVWFIPFILYLIAIVIVLRADDNDLE